MRTLSCPLATSGSYVGNEAERCFYLSLFHGRDLSQSCLHEAERDHYEYRDSRPCTLIGEGEQQDKKSLDMDTDGRLEEDEEFDSDKRDRTTTASAMMTTSNEQSIKTIQVDEGRNLEIVVNYPGTEQTANQRICLAKSPSLLSFWFYAYYYSRRTEEVEGGCSSED